MPTPAIRCATAEDAPPLAAFAARVFPLGCPVTDPSDLESHIASELSPERFRALIEDPNLLVLLAESSQSIVAYTIAARRSPHPAIPATPGELRKLYLDPAHHGTGLADALLHCALSTLNAEIPRPLWLSVFSGNPRAIAFYKKWGFEVIGEQIFLVGTDPQKDFLMRRPASAELIAQY